jgi:hypothetical protein
MKESECEPKDVRSSHKSELLDHYSCNSCDNNFAFEYEPKRSSQDWYCIRIYFRIKKARQSTCTPPFVCRFKVALCPSLIMKNVLFLWLVPFLLLIIPSVQWYYQTGCFGDPYLGQDNLTCNELYPDCLSCIRATMRYNCNGWCPVSRRCSYGWFDSCDAGEELYEGSCPLDTVNPAFDNEECISLSWELYRCNQWVDSVDHCDESYVKNVTNYCTLDNQTSTQLCNGQDITLRRGIWKSTGYFRKNPTGVELMFWPGNIWFSSECYRFHYKPIADAIVCAPGDTGNRDTFALKYTLAPLGGRVLTTESTVAKKTTTTSHLRQPLT